MINGKSLLDYTHPIGTLYTRDDPTSPAQLFGGVWEQLTADAYLKIVTANGGAVGGTNAEHKIPGASMPSHNHLMYINVDNRGACWTCSEGGYYVPQGGGLWEYATTYAGGSEPYYPYYFGVYAWIRVE